MTDPLDFSGKTVLVIGGSSGIGNGIAQAFRARGADVHVTGTRADAGGYQGSEDSDLEGLTYHQLNVSERDKADALAAKLPRLDVLIQSQGIVRYNREEFQRAGWDDVMNINLNSLMDVARAFHPALSQVSGTMIIVSSITGFTAVRGNPAYAASKAAAISLVKSLGEGWASAKNGNPVRVNAIAPGYVPTKLTSVMTEHPERIEAMERMIPMRRLGTPEDMAGVALFLASSMAAYMTGQTIVVDGGLTLS